jgi:hypothetical protein
MTNHPLRKCTKNLLDVSPSQTTAIGELEYMAWVIQEITYDNKKLGDVWLMKKNISRNEGDE